MTNSPAMIDQRNITAIIQARMTSSRLPGKTLQEVNGVPLICHLISRLKRSRMINQIVLATSTDRSDDPIEVAATSMGIQVCRGPLGDVLKRYVLAAALGSSRHIMRITGDCPLVDPQICDRLAEFYFKGRFEYAALSSRFAEGLDAEIFSLQALHTADANARTPSEREHVTLYFRNNPAVFLTGILPKEEDEGHYRITVDEPQDFDVVASIIQALGTSSGKCFASWPKIKEFLDTHPQIKDHNAHIERNAGLKASLARAKHSDLIQIGLKVWAKNTSYIAQSWDLVKRGVCDFVELYVHQDATESQRDAWRDAALPIRLHAPHSYGGFNPALNGDLKDKMRIVALVDDYRAHLNPLSIIFHPGIEGKIEESLRQYACFKRAFPELFKIAYIENKPQLGQRGEICRGSTPDEIKPFIHELDFGFCLDFGHAACRASWAKENWHDVVESFLALSPGLFHISDGDINSPVDTHLHLGRGNFPLVKMLAMLPSKAPVTLETPHDSAEDLDDFITDAEFIRRTLA